jgi:hypothetical protein
MLHKPRAWETVSFLARLHEINNTNSINNNNNNRCGNAGRQKCRLKGSRKEVEIPGTHFC